LPQVSYLLVKQWRARIFLHHLFNGFIETLRGVDKSAIKIKNHSIVCIMTLWYQMRWTAPGVALIVTAANALAAHAVASVVVATHLS
jgi:hypothetical protein